MALVTVAERRAGESARLIAAIGAVTAELAGYARSQGVCFGRVVLVAPDGDLPNGARLF